MSLDRHSELLHSLTDHFTASLPNHQFLHLGRTPILPRVRQRAHLLPSFVTVDDLCSAAKEVAPLSLGARPEVLADIFREAERTGRGRVGKREFKEIVTAGGAL